jgi:ZIP family zinc transporter
MGSTTVEWLAPLINATIAGSATCLGGALIFFIPTPERHIAFTLSLAAGVMVTVSIFDLYLPVARTSFFSFVLATGALLAGAGFTALISRMEMPEPERLLVLLWGGGVAVDGVGGGGGAVGASSPRLRGEGPLSSAEGGSEGAPAAAVAAAAEAPPRDAKSWRLGMLLFLILTLHNLPEGMAVGVSTVKSRELGLALVVGIFLHNIFEGVVIAVPLLAATGDKWLALSLTAASGLSEPLGAAVGVLLLRGVAGKAGAAALAMTLNVVLCGVGGVMLQVCRNELLPSACRVGEPRVVAAGFLAGALLIGVSIYCLPV